MTFEETMKKVARRAETGAKLGMTKLAAGKIKHEDDLTPALAQAIEDQVNGYAAGGVTWDASVLTHRKGGEEGVYGADLLIHVRLNTPQYKYSKGILVQAKRIAPGKTMPKGDHTALVGQCNKMLDYTPASFVFAYDPRGLRAGSATKIAGTPDRAIYDQCSWTAYRFFLELFRCPVGDPRIISASVTDLPQPKYELKMSGRGDLQLDRISEIPG